MNQADASPLTDFRAIGASALVHAVLIVLASLAAFGVGAPRAPQPPKVLSGEIGPVENRAPSAIGGGSPDDLGGTSERVRLSAEALPARGRDSVSAADRLIADALPSPSARSDLPALDLGPPTTGLGLIAGDGAGGGGGSGGGSGGGVGKGIGPGTEFFGAKERAASFVFVIDCSGSMSHLNALRIAKAELSSSLDRLPPDARFSVVFYNLQASVFPDPDGKDALMPATRANKERLRARLASVRSDGGTDHARALRAAFALKPEVIFFLTDAERLEGGDVEPLREEAGAIRIQAIEFGDGPASGAASHLGDLAIGTGGTFRHLDLSTWAGEGAARP